MSTSLPQFDGADYRPDDHPRLSTQYRRIWEYMADGDWYSLSDIAYYTGAPEASVSAQLRHMRKARFGANIVERERFPAGGYLYRLIPTETGQELVNRTATR